MKKFKPALADAIMWAFIALVVFGFVVPYLISYPATIVNFLGILTILVGIYAVAAIIMDLIDMASGVTVTKKGEGKAANDDISDLVLTESSDGVSVKRKDGLMPTNDDINRVRAYVSAKKNRKKKS